MISHFIAAAIIPAYENIAEDFSISITKASYLTSLQIAIVGFAPLFWKPISNRYGRRPVWLISTLGSALLNVGCAFSDSYSTMAVCRAFVAFFISPPVGIGSGVVTETYFKKQRGQFMGLWTLLLTLGQWRFIEIFCLVSTIPMYADESISGPPLGPFVMGFVVTQTGNYRWIYRVLAIINGVQFLFALFLQPETLYIRKGVQHVGSAFKQEYLTFGRLDPKPLKIYEFIQPLSLFKYPSILIPTIAYSMVFGFCSVLLTVEIPQLFIPKFGFNAQQIGLQFLGIIIGSLIGEQIGGRLSDFWMHRKAKQMAYHALPPPPEHRLWLSYFGFVLAMVGLIVFGVRFQQLPAHQYDVSPIVGIAISAVGNQIVTTVSTTYAIDCHVEHSASIGIFINVIRSTWAFIGKSAAAEEGERINPSLSHRYPIPSHCDGTHTQNLLQLFFSLQRAMELATILISDYIQQVPSGIPACYPLSEDPVQADSWQV